MLVLCALLAVPFGVMSAICRYAGTTSAEPGARKVALQHDEMIIQGPVDAALSAAVEATLRPAHAPVTTVLLASLGGNEDDARQIARALARLGLHRIVVPPGFACESACLLIALADGNGFAPADNARLMFHREWRIIGPQWCLACQPMNWLKNAVTDWRLGPQEHRAMQRWADSLAPGLGERLAACKPNPFDTLAGITITGGDFKAFRAGDSGAVKCTSGAQSPPR